MQLGFLDAAVPAITVIVVLLVLENWAFFKARNGIQRAAITGAAVFLIFLVFNLFADPSF